MCLITLQECKWQIQTGKTLFSSTNNLPGIRNGKEPIDYKTMHRPYLTCDLNDCKNTFIK